MKSRATKLLAGFAASILLFLCIPTFAQTPGLIVRPAGGPYSTVLDPNGDGYTSIPVTPATTPPSSLGFIGSDVGAAYSEIPFKIIPPYQAEPTADLMRGPSDKFSDLVKLDANESGFYVYSTGGASPNMLFRMRLGDIVSGSKGYSVLVDADGKFGASGAHADPNYQAATTGINGNPGFEYEVVLETNFRIAVYNVDGASTGTLLNSYAIGTNSQISIAYSTVSSTPDYFYDFYVPLSAFSNSAVPVTATTLLRLSATTVMSPQGAIGGPKSDIFGYAGTDYMKGWEAIINAQSSFTPNDVTATGTGVKATCTAPPTVNSPINAGTVTVNGTWTSTGGLNVSTTATITLYKVNTSNVTSVVGTVSATSGTTWSVASVTAAAGDKFYAKALSNGETSCLESNSVVVPSCASRTLNTSIAITCTSDRGFDGTAPANAIVRLYRVTAAGYTLYADQTTTLYKIARPGATTRWTYDSVNTNSSNPCTGGQADVTVGQYAVTIEEPGKCESDYFYVSNGTCTATATPTITQATLYVGGTTISGTAPANSTVRMFKDGALRFTTTANASGTYAFTGLSLALNEVIDIYAQLGLQCVSSKVTRTVTCFSYTPVINTTASGNLIVGATSITGTSPGISGATIRIYNSSNTLLGSTTLQTDGTWSVAITVASGVSYYATAQRGTCTVSAPSATVSALGATTICPTITGTYNEASTKIDGTFSGSFTGTVRLYQDGTEIGSATYATGTTTWSITPPNTGAGVSPLYPGGILSTTTQSTGAAESTTCTTTVTIACAPPAIPAVTPTSAVPYDATGKIKYTITNSQSGILYTLENAAGVDQGQSLFGNGGSLTLISKAILVPGVYSFKITALKLSASNCATTSTAVTATVGDNDGDGIVDPVDEDDDNDGVPDTIENGGVSANGDVDNDGVRNYKDADFCTLNAKGVCASLDKDGDGIINQFDLDSDNDVIPDLVEAGGVDTNGDGRVDYTGTFASNDSDNDGLINRYDASTSGTAIGSLDTDGDGVLNLFDLDSDNDAIPDLVEVGGVDTNGDGRADGTFTDTDNDGFIDSRDSDVGNDGTPENIVKALLLTGADANNDGKPDSYSQGIANTDGRALPNPYDLDSDDDGISDLIEGGGTDSDNNGKGDYTGTFAANDTDGDGFIDSRDGDVGNDGTSENLANVLIPTGADANNDGRPDTYPKANADGSALPNPYDADSDNDGIPDLVEAGGVDTNGDGLIDNTTDANTNGWADAYDPTQSGINLRTLDANGATAGGSVFDFDGDGIPNYQDLDSDGDGIPDLLEQGGTDSNIDGMVDATTDADNDGFIDTVDPLHNSTGAALGTALITTAATKNSYNLPDGYSAGDNFDGKGLINMLDLDSDDDGLTDVKEAGLTDANNDGAADGTLGTDGWSDTVDALATLTLVNTDGITGANYLDLDSDNDGIVDILEIQATAAYLTPLNTDTDADGIDDRYDTNVSVFGGTGLTPVNTDGDAAADYMDLDSDNDAYPDFVEGHDMDGNNIPDVASPAANGVSGGTTDADNDGLLDGYDNNTAGALSTNGTIILDYPNIDKPATTERDWREASDVDNDSIIDKNDVDDDNDGITDLIESGGTDPLADADSDGIPNYMDATPGGTVPLFTDSNSDGLNDAYDADKDGVLNLFDLDSDNDGIPDLIEAGGTDTDGNGRVDYTGTIASNDSNSNGLINTYEGANAIGSLDSDGDGIKNIFDLDSDGDGIPDVVEAAGTDTNNDGRFDASADTDRDGWADAVDGDVGNDGTSENGSNVLILTGADTNNDGKPESYVRGDFDRDNHPNAYDLDSDGDGILDVWEAGFGSYDTNKTGILSSADAGYADANSDGWSDAIDALVTLTLINTDATGKADYLDIDADDDGITDNVEGQSTSGYLAPLGTFPGTDADGDGINDRYDSNTALFGSNTTNGIQPVNTDGTDAPDFRDTDSDNDTDPDRIEGNDLNANHRADDTPATIPTTDTDDDGLLDFFESNVSNGPYVTIAGFGGTTSFSSKSTAQKTLALATERDWRNSGFSLSTYVILPVRFLQIEARPIANAVKLIWTVAGEQDVAYYEVERSLDGRRFSSIGTVAYRPTSEPNKAYTFTDNEAMHIRLHYRIRQVDANGQATVSKVVVIDAKKAQTALALYPNPTTPATVIVLTADAAQSVRLQVRDAQGKLVLTHLVQVQKGQTIVPNLLTQSLPKGVYIITALLDSTVQQRSFIK